MFHVKVSFYGRGNAPRKLGPYTDQRTAENEGFYILSRYENRPRTSFDTRRIKKVEVIDKTTDTVVRWWGYTREYDREFFCHTWREDEWDV